MPRGRGGALVIGGVIALEIHAEIAAIAGRPEGASAIPAAAAARLVDLYGLGSPTELALLALPVAEAMARPIISGYRVAAVGIEAETGDLLLGANLEFPGGELTTTIHAEGFVALRARSRGRSLATLAVREAHPCAHCRQTLSESAAADGLTLIDPAGSSLKLADLYPWPFRPAALGAAGDEAGRTNWPGLTFVAPTPPRDIAAVLLQAGATAHAPYSKAPSAVVLRTRGGLIHASGNVESVAFNPSISAFQGAVVEVVAAREDPGGISEAWLAATDGGLVDPAPAFLALLRAIAPDAVAHVVRWRLG